MRPRTILLGLGVVAISFALTLLGFQLFSPQIGGSGPTPPAAQPWGTAWAGSGPAAAGWAPTATGWAMRLRAILSPATPGRAAIEGRRQRYRHRLAAITAPERRPMALGGDDPGRRGNQREQQ